MFDVFSELFLEPYRKSASADGVSAVGIEVLKLQASCVCFNGCGSTSP